MPKLEKHHIIDWATNTLIFPLEPDEAAFLNDRISKRTNFVYLSGDNHMTISMFQMTLAAVGDLLDKQMDIIKAETITKSKEWTPEDLLKDMNEYDDYMREEYPKMYPGDTNDKE